MIEDLAERYLVGRDPHDIENFFRRAYSSGFTQRPDVSVMGCFSALEIACWDIIGKEAGKPVYKLLGGQVHETLRSYTYLYPHSGSVHTNEVENPDKNVYNDPDLAAECASLYVEQGFNAVKLDPAGPYTAFDGHQPRLIDIDLSARMVKAIREAVGTRADILFGTHGQFTASGALRMARAIEPYDPLWFEEPVPPDMPEVMAQVARGTSIPIATGERLTTKFEFARVIENARRHHPAARSRPLRRHPRNQEDRRDGRGLPYPGRAALLLRADRRRRQHPARRDAAQLPDPGIAEAVGRLPRQAAEEEDRMAGRQRDPVEGARPRRRARRGGLRSASLQRQDCICRWRRTRCFPDSEELNVAEGERSERDQHVSRVG